MAPGAMSIMVLIDATVWIDFFAGPSLPQVKALENLLENRDNLCICGIISTEVLQGIRMDSEFKRTEDLFSNLIFLAACHSVFLRSGGIYRSLRHRGIAIKKTAARIIASVALENDIALRDNGEDSDTT